MTEKKKAICDKMLHVGEAHIGGYYPIWYRNKVNEFLDGINKSGLKKLTMRDLVSDSIDHYMLSNKHRIKK